MSGGLAGPNHVGIRKSGISQSIIRVVGDGLIKTVDGLLECILAALVPEVSTQQVELVSLRVLGVTLDQMLRLLISEALSQTIADAFGHAILDRQQISELSVK